MAILTIDLPPSTGRGFKFRTSLNGVLYRFEFHFCVRDGATPGEGSWHFNLFDASGRAIALGIRAVVDFPLLELVTDPRKPAGRLALIDTSGTGTEPGREDLGSRVKFVYDDGV